MEILVLGAGLLTFAAVRQEANASVKNLYPAGEKERSPGEGLLSGYEEGQDRNNLLFNRRNPNFPVALVDRIPLVDEKLGGLFGKDYEGVLSNPEFAACYAWNYARHNDEVHELLDTDRLKYPYNTRYVRSRFLGGAGDVNILGPLVGNY